MRIRHLLLALLLLPATAAAQGSISNQGFGYPLGALSSAAASMAGANGEVDANSAINPAAIPRANRFAFSFRLEPEFRNTTVGAASGNATLSRFPMLQATGGLGRFIGSVSIATMLDRTWRNQYEDTLLIGDDMVPSVLQIGSEGAMSDARAAVAYIISPRYQVGLGLHAITGENRTVFLRQFDPNAGVSPVSQSNSFGFTGMAYSFGAIAEPVENLLLSASARIGRDMKLERLGEEVASAKVPSRFGFGAAYVGIRGVSLHARIDQTAWSDLDGLASDSVTTFDATELSVGAEFLGPRVFGVNSALRTGFRTRTLPFGVNGNQVDESGFAFGLGIPLARGRSRVDVGLQRMTRTTPGAEEKAWHLSLGLGIRP